MNRRITTTIFISVLLAALSACSQPEAPVAPTVTEVAITPGKVENQPWSDRTQTVTPANPYENGRSFPWTGVRVGGKGISSQALGAGVNYLSDLTYTSASSGYGPLELDKSNGEAALGDGRTLTIGGQTYAKGLGVHANSTINYTLSSACSTFTAFVGVDDEVGLSGSLSFQIYADGTKLYDSGVVTGADAAKAVNVNLTGKTELRLVVDGNGDLSSDHADWADAKVSCLAPTPSNSPYLSDVSPSAASSGWGPIEKDRSNGENQAADGQPLKLRGTTYAKGWGVHANSSLSFPLNGNCTLFTALVGLDDEVQGKGSVLFQVFADGSKLYDSGAVGGTDAAKAVSVDVTGKTELKLVVDGNGVIDYDHADWADAKLVCAAPVVPTEPLTIELSNPVSTLGAASEFSVDVPDAQSVTWAFSDGGSASGEGVAHTFSKPGLYTATATIVQADGKTVTVSQQTAILPEIQDIVKQRATGDSMTVSFDAGEPLPGFEYSYELGDGSSASGSRVKHTYQKIGTYDYTLTIRDARPQALSGQGLKTQAVTDPVAYSESSWQTVWRRAPQAKFSISGLSTATTPGPIAVGTVGATATFDASASTDLNTTPSPLTYLWDFGDGSTATTATAVHTYPAMNRYVVSLTVTNEFGLSDTFRNIVHIRDPKTNFRMNVEQSSPVLTLQTQNLTAAAVATPSTTNSDVLNYFPYVLPASNKIKGATFKSLNLDGTPANSFCSQLTANLNGIDVPVLKSELPELGVDGDGFATFCRGLTYTAGLPARDRTISSFFVTSSRYLEDSRFSVFTGLAVPKVILGVYPDEFISGELASPSVKEYRTVNPASGKTEWLMQVNVRQSEVKDGSIRLKIPVLALDAAGAFRNNATGRFKASFADASLQSDCGDCTMVGGRGSITVTLPVSKYDPAQQTLNLSSIVLGTDNGCLVTDMFTSANFRLTGCATLPTTTLYPSVRAPEIALDPYPARAELAGHIYYGAGADAVKALKIYAQIGHVLAHATVEFTAPFLLAAEHREQLDETAYALYADGKLTLKERGQLLLANIGYIFSYIPQTVGTPRPNYFAMSAQSARGLGGSARAFDAVVNVEANRGLTVTASEGLLRTQYGELAQLGSLCPSCIRNADSAISELVAAGKTEGEAASALSNFLASNKVKLAGLPENIKVSIARLALVCRKVPALGLRTLGNTGPFACQVPFTRYSDRYDTGLRGLPDKQVVGEYRGQLQRHHGLQQGWMKANIPKDINGKAVYKGEAAPVITLETNSKVNVGDITPPAATVPDLPHTIISRLQEQRRIARLRAQLPEYGTSIQEELQFIVDDFTSTGLGNVEIKTVLEQNYALLDKLKFPYTKLAGW
jgi:PKD repeat protein